MNEFQKQLAALMAQGYTSAQRLLAMGFNVNALRTNGTLRKEEWVQYDTAIIQAAQERLVGVADLLSRGLVYNIGNGLGKTVLESEKVSDMNDAEMSMDGITRGSNDTVEFDMDYLPLPIVHKDYTINIRKLNASRTTGESLDVTQAALAARKVATKIENLLFNGSGSYAFGGGTIYGYLDFPTRETKTLTAKWDAATAAQILADVLAMKQKLIDKKHYGPYVLYIRTKDEVAFDKDYDTVRGNTIRNRVLQIGGISDIKTADVLPNSTVDHCVLAQMTADSVRMVVGLPISNVEWQEMGGMVFNYKVMTIQVPQIRQDDDGNVGVCHGSKS